MLTAAFGAGFSSLIHLFQVRTVKGQMLTVLETASGEDHGEIVSIQWVFPSRRLLVIMNHRGIQQVESAS